MNASTDKWWIGALAVVVALVGGFSIHLMSDTGKTPPAKPDKTAASTTEVQPPPLKAEPVASSQPDNATSQQQAAATTQPAQTEAVAPPVQKEAAVQPEQPTETAPQPAEQASPPVAITAADTSDYGKARWNPIHFKPAIDKASNADCLQCHQEVMDSKVRESSPAGVKASDSLAWYQTLDTYEGEQMTFHQRHLTTPFINKVANMNCTTCHQGNDPREETGTSSANTQEGLALRKMVNPNTCLMCHGQFPYQNMGLPGPWHESGAAFQNNCLMCHAAIRTARHQVNFLKADAIEKEGVANSDTCYGCHGGRAWYRTSFPYPRHPWPGSSATVPDWAKDRPTESDLRFLIEGSKP